MVELMLFQSFWNELLESRLIVSIVVTTIELRDSVIWLVEVF